LPCLNTEQKSRQGSGGGREERTDRERRVIGAGERGQPCLPQGQEVAQPSAEQEEAAEGDQVRVDDPRERLLRKPEIRLIDGSPTPTIVTSRTTIRSPRQRTRNASRRRSLTLTSDRTLSKRYYRPFYSRGEEKR
jgi:hypothetical protein